jgi:hypothetical protein
MSINTQQLYSTLTKKDNGLVSFNTIQKSFNISIGMLTRALQDFDTSSGVTLDHFEFLINHGHISVTSTFTSGKDGLTEGLTIPRAIVTSPVNGVYVGDLERVSSYETFMSNMERAYSNLDNDTRYLLERELEVGSATGQLRAFMRLASENNTYQETLKQARELGKSKLENVSQHATETIKDISG